MKAAVRAHRSMRLPRPGSTPPSATGSRSSTKDRIRFNVVAPGSIVTAFHDDKDQATLDRISGTILMGRFGTTDEVAPAHLFLASHACSGYITGQILDVNGGQICPDL